MPSHQRKKWQKIKHKIGDRKIRVGENGFVEFQGQEGKNEMKWMFEIINIIHYYTVIKLINSG